MFGELRGLSYDDLCRAARWNIPKQFNMGTACIDAQSPKSVALVVQLPSGEVRRHTFGQITSWSNSLCNAFRGGGISRGDRLGIFAPQSVETALAHVSTYRIGAIAVPLSPLLGPDGLKYRLADSEAKAIVTNREGADKLMEVIGELPSLRFTLVTDLERSTTGLLGFWEVIESASSYFTPARTSAEEPVLLLYTSGTTGFPKGALHAHRFLIGHLPGMELSHDFFPQPGDLFWTPSDWAWVAGLMDALIPSWFFGVPVLCAPRGSFDPDWAFQMLRKHGVRNVFLPPSALKLMRQTARIHPGLRVRTVMSGGEVLGEETHAWASEVFGVTINEAYGQTEANLLVGNSAAAWPVRPGSMGRPYPGHRVEIHTDDGVQAKIGEVGQIVLETPNPITFLEYIGNPESTGQKYQGRWLQTGDLATRDEDGYLWFYGRRDDIIKSSGYRIGPAEIEDCIMRHDSVALAAVIGIPDPIRGEAVKAFIVLRAGVSASAELERAIRSRVRERLAAYQYPRFIEFVDELPMTPTGKIRRSELRRMAKPLQPGSPA